MKKAVLVVSFGTSYKETREKTIEACEKEIQRDFTGYDFFRAYTSRIIIKKIAKTEGILIDTEEEALNRIYELGYEEVVVQSLHIICGDEFTKLKESIMPYQNKFKKLTLGMPLLTDQEDHHAVIQGLKEELPLLNTGEALVWMGHGTEHEAHVIYCELRESMMKAGLTGYLGTMGGEPGLEMVIESLKKDKIHTVYLAPFMLVAGSHAIRDMGSEAEDSWKSILEKEGFNVRLMIKGLGEYKGVRGCFIAHAKKGISQ